MNARWEEALTLHCRKLFLRDYEININIGIHEFEKKGEQRVIVNVDIYVPFSLSTPQHDKLEEVVDYDFIRQVIAKRVALGHVHLQETLCDDVLSTILEHPKVMAAKVSTQKPDVYPDCAAVGVEVFRMKPFETWMPAGSQ